MNAVRILTVLIIGFGLAGCGERSEDVKLAWRDGLMYETESGKLFDGKLIRYYPSGPKRRECEYRNGKKHGKQISWYENGRKKLEIEWWKGGKHGKWFSWYENGRKKAEGEFRNRKRQGKVIFWREDGQKELELEFRDHEEISRKEFGTVITTPRLDKDG